MYLNVLGKKFVNIATGKTIMVTEQDNDIITLDGTDIVSLELLLNKNAYDDYIDPADFFKSGATLDMLSSKIMSVPDDILAQMPNDQGEGERGSEFITESLGSINNNFYPKDSESMIIDEDPDYEMHQMQEKLRKMSVNPIGLAQTQSETLMALVNDDQTNGDTVVNIIETPSTTFSNPLPYIQNTSSSQKIPQNDVVVDPIIAMFNGVKRNVDFDFGIKISKLIPRIDFIEMMEDSYNQSIIDYLATEFTNEILSNPSKIKDLITEGIKNMVYPQITKKKALSTKKATPVSTPKVKEEVSTKPRNTKRQGAPKTQTV